MSSQGVGISCDRTSLRHFNFVDFHSDVMPTGIPDFAFFMQGQLRRN